MKIRIFSLLLALWAIGVSNSQAQITTYLFTNSSWEVAQSNNFYNPPLSFDQIMTGNWWLSWRNAEEDPNFNCASAVPPFPGIPIFVPGWGDCRNLGDVDRTGFFRKTFTLNGDTPICSAILEVKADNYFRVYLDGMLIPGQDLLPCTEGPYNSYQDLQGNDFSQIVSVDLTNFLDYTLDSHTIIIEVGTCDVLHFLSADLLIQQQMNCIPNPAITYSFANTDAGCTLQIGGTTECYTFEDWRVFYKPVGASAYSLIYSRNANQRIGAKPIIPISYGCGYYRIFHRTWHTCGDTIVSRETLTNPIYYCCTGGGGREGLPQAEDGLLSLEQAGLPNTTEQPSLPEIATAPVLATEVTAYPNPVTQDLNLRFNAPFTGRVDLIDPFGRVVDTQVAEEAGSLSFDLAPLPAGFYWVFLQTEAGVQKLKVVKQ